MKLTLDKTIPLGYAYPEMAICLSIKERWEKILSFFRARSRNELISLSIVLFLVVTLPIAVTAARYQTYKKSRAFDIPLTPPVTPIPSPTPTLPPKLSPIGEQRTLVIMFNFQDKPNDKPFTREGVSSAIFTGPNSLNSYYKEVSFNQTWFTGKVVGWYTIPFNSGPGCYYDVKAVEDMAKAEGVDVDSYRRRIYLNPYVSACGTSGSTDGNPSTTTLNGTIDLYTLLHEVGHNLTLGHAHGLNCGKKAIDNYKNCQVINYGDPYSPQGSGTYHHNSFHKASLGWIPSSRIQEIMTSGIYKIYPLERPETGIQVLKIKKPNTEEYYYLEYRRPIGFDTNLPPKITEGVLIHIGYNIPYVIWPETFLSPETYLIDATPGTLDGFGDAALSDKTSFYDEINNITITQIGRNENSATVSVAIRPSPSTSTPTPFPITPTPYPVTPTPVPTPPMPENCNKECISRKFASGYCDTVPVYPGKSLCKPGETNIGLTQDCNVKRGILGVNKDCCCVPACVPYTCQPGSWTIEKLKKFSDTCWRKSTPECLIYDHDCDKVITVADIQYISGNCLQPNNNPQITTTSLPQGTLGKVYQAKVTAIDTDAGDKLTMTISNLSSGLYQRRCYSSTSQRWDFFGGKRTDLTCEITGTPKQSGNFPVKVLVEDNKGGRDQKSLQLRISESGRRTYPWSRFFSR